MSAARQGSEKSCASGCQKLGEWMAAWAPSKPPHLPPSPHPNWPVCPTLDCKQHRSQHSSSLAARSCWHQAECTSWCFPISVHSAASPHSETPQTFPLHPFSLTLCHQSCLMFPHLYIQTDCWPWWSQRPSAPPSLQHGQDCACPEQAVLSLCCLLVTSVGPWPVCKNK